MNRDYRIVPIKRRLAVLASGGLDSSVMLAELARGGREVFPVYVRAGLMWERHELGALRSYIRRLKLRGIHAVSVLQLPMGDVAGGHWSMTGRKSAGLSRGRIVELDPGPQSEPAREGRDFLRLQPDWRDRDGAAGEQSVALTRGREFFRALERAIDLGVGLRLKILTPYVGMTKGEVIRRGANLPLRFTVTCARPEGVTHCGRCTKCAERIQGFREAGVPDPTEYARRPPRRA